MILHKHVRECSNNKGMDTKTTSVMGEELLTFIDNVNNNRKISHSRV
jgi:hypothetical protein